MTTISTMTIPANSNAAARANEGPIAASVVQPAKAETAGRKPVAPAAGRTKTDTVLKMLRKAKGATIAQLTAATGWQAHSVRGFLSGTVRKKLGLILVSDIGKDGQRRYRIVDSTDMAD